MGTKGELVLERSPTEPQDDYVHMSEILPDDFPVFPDGAGEVEEIPSSLPDDGTLFYFQSSFVFDTFPGSDGYFGFSNDTTYNNKVGSYGAVLAAGDYYIDFTTSRAYSYLDNFSLTYVHLCESQLTISGAGPLTDWDYEVIFEFYPGANSPPKLTSDVAMLGQHIRWWDGTMFGIDSNPIMGPALPLPWGIYADSLMIANSQDGGQSWSNSVVHNVGPGGPERVGIQYVASPPRPKFLWNQLNKAVLGKIYDRDWLPFKGSNSQMHWSIDGGQNFYQGWNIMDYQSFGLPAFEQGNSMTSDNWALDQRYRIDPAEYGAEHNFWVEERASSSFQYGQPFCWHATRTGLGGFVLQKLWKLPGNERTGQARSLLVGSDNHMLFMSASGKLWRSINHAAPTVLVNWWPDLYPAGPEKASATGTVYLHVFQPDTFDEYGNDDVWAWNLHSGSCHLWHSSDAGVTWTWLTDPATGGTHPSYHSFGGMAPAGGGGSMSSHSFWRLSADKFIAAAGTWPRDLYWWLSEDAGKTWNLMITWGGWGFQSASVNWPYPDPATSTTFTAAEGNLIGLQRHGTLSIEKTLLAESEFYLWGGWMGVNSPGFPAIQDNVMRLLRINIFPDDAVVENICDSAGFIIREGHPRDLKTKLLQLNSRVFTRGSNGNISFEIVDSEIYHRDAYVKREVRSVHYDDLKTAFDSKVKSKVSAVAGGAFYTDGIDLTDPEYYIKPPVMNTQSGPGGTPTEEASISIRTLISMRKIIQALYTSGWFCACYSYCPCQTDISVSGEKK